MKRILVVSDVHAATSKVSRLASVERDMTIVAGDLAKCGSVEEALAVLDMLVAQSQPVIWVPGNCDSPKLLEEPGPKGSYNVHGRAVRFDSLVFVGVGGSPPTPFNTPLEFSEDQIKRVLTEALRTVDAGERLVIVSHSPPYASGLDRVRGGAYVGSRAVAEVIAEWKPLLVASGHIHESWGVSCMGGSILVNPGPLAEGRYALVLFDEDVGAVNVRLRRL
jgi:Icc-related predicted phosphoesterase